MSSYHFQEVGWLVYEFKSYLMDEISAVNLTCWLPGYNYNLICAYITNLINKVN